jgi:hypothetical protein|tara:strand:+ start:840 stop:1088 length:249 start_codon:yes stop_codon:yes gene_type:complete
MDKRINNGGKRIGAGRKPKAQEKDLIEKLDLIIDNKQVIEKLKVLIDKGDIRALNLYMGYRYGKPKETKDIHINDDQPIFID